MQEVVLRAARRDDAPHHREPGGCVPATGAPSIRCRGRGRCAARSRSTSASTRRLTRSGRDDAVAGDPDGPGPGCQLGPGAAAAGRLRPLAEPGPRWTAASSSSGTPPTSSGGRVTSRPSSRMSERVPTAATPT